MQNYLKFKNKRLSVTFVLLAILLIAAFFRIFDLNWDQNQHLHPDERFLTMVTQDIKFPEPLITYFIPHLSSLNPYNAGYNFFVYGTFPLNLVKLVSQIIIFDQFSYNNITLVGRLFSGLFDLGILVLIYLIGKKGFNFQTGLLASFLYLISVLPIQLSHFFTVDSFLVFFLTLSFYFLLYLTDSQKHKHKSIPAFFLGISFGLALACKVSALYFLPIIILGFLYYLIKTKNLKFLLLSTCYFLLATYLTFRFADPRVFVNSNIFDPQLNPQFVANLKQLKSFDDPNSLFPPAIQWIKTKPIIFPLKNIILWGLGLPLGVLTVTAVLYTFYYFAKIFAVLLKKYKFKFIKHLTIKQFNYFLILLWILLLFFYQGTQFVKTMRYFYPIYPFLTILAANFLYQCIDTLKNSLNHKIFSLLLVTCYLLLLIYPLSFISIYTKPHSRVTASEWIYKNIPNNSTLSCDLWDDCLPLNIEKVGYSNQYKILSMEPFAPDTNEKWTKFNYQLEQLDYLILTSNRTWGSITKVQDKYPLMSQFYQNLFAGKLDFEKVAEITSYPTIPILNIPIKDDFAEEAFTVYDHPKVLIFKKQ